MRKKQLGGFSSMIFYDTYDNDDGFFFEFFFFYL